MEDELLKWNRMGLIPGPAETLEDFKKRADYCLKLKSDFEKEIDIKNYTFPEAFSLSLIQEAGEITRPLFDIIPEWTPVIFSNHRLMPWHGGCAWIFQMSKEEPTAAFFQLRQAFLHASTYLGIYNRKELIAHETAHIGRMLFNEPKFEELIAYRTSKSWFRRFISPIIQSPWEANLFIFTLLTSLLVPFFMGFHPEFHFLWLAPIFLLAVGLIRTCLRQKQFSQCLQNLKKLTQNDDCAHAIIFRLQDHEIISFAKMPPERIMEYIHQWKSEELRWKVIAAAYFP